MNIVVLILYLLFAFVGLCAFLALGICGFIGSCFMWVMRTVEWLARLASRK